MVVCAGAALAAEGDHCLDAASLVHADAPLPRASAAITHRHEIKVLVVGTGSSILAGATGTRAYPLPLQSALAARWPRVAVSVVTAAKVRQTAAEMAQSFDQLLMDHKPDLVIWQTGTADAMRGLDPDAFRGALEKGVDRIEGGSADVMLMNMQYSPRTESIIALDLYAETMRGVALQREIPIFDRLAVMKEWNDQGIFDLSAKTKNSDMAEHVHECIGRLLAALVIEAVDMSKEAKEAQ